MKLKHITARHRTSLKVVDLFYTSIKQAVIHNIGLTDFKYRSPEGGVPHPKCAY